MDAAELPPPPAGFEFYNYQWSFNVITKRFAVQRHLEPRAMCCRGEAPWLQQELIPWVPRPGVLHVRRFDADEADFCPTRLSFPEKNGEREVPEGWKIELQGLQEHMADTNCPLYHDGDFTVMILEDFKRIFVWSFVEDEEGEDKAGSGARGSPAIDVCGLGISADPSFDY
ncbi:hypothetical protein IMZ48_45200 [Candidatus Bathyarchaeota archaeon]|nr:hypothetical protein [Candidatus Bathyarchaeota archaeon]